MPKKTGYGKMPPEMQSMHGSMATQPKPKAKLPKKPQKSKKGAK